MNLNFDLDLKQKQSLIMNQEMKLSLKILQMNSMEIEKFIFEEFDNNPMLDFNDRVDRFINYSINSFNLRNFLIEDDEHEEIDFKSEQEGLHDVLKKQLRLTNIDNKSKKIGYYIIDNINENGYLEIGEEEIAKDLDCDITDVCKVLNLIKTFEPNGIGAKNLKECLLIQLKNMGKLDNNLEFIINNHIDDIAKGRFKKISSNLKIEEEIVRKYVGLIKSLNPRPGLYYNCEKPQFIIPDLLVEEINGEFEVRVIYDIIPEIKINKNYIELLKNKDSDEFNYAKTKLRQAFFIIKSLEERKKTLITIAKALVELQRDFFLGKNLKPINLKRISLITNLHPSTISRAINGKYILTPKGIFELKKLFSRETKSMIGSLKSVDEIKATIKKLIDNEPKSKPLSDEKIVSLLKDNGIDIARRTVAKYREELGIPSSSIRKK